MRGWRRAVLRIRINLDRDALAFVGREELLNFGQSFIQHEEVDTAPTSLSPNENFRLIMVSDLQRTPGMIRSRLLYEHSNEDER